MFLCRMISTLAQRTEAPRIGIQNSPVLCFLFKDTYQLGKLCNITEHGYEAATVLLSGLEPRSV